jgi:hypothetical protein
VKFHVFQHENSFFYFSLEILNKNGQFFIKLPLINGLKPLKSAISQKQLLAKLLFEFKNIY